VCAEKEKRKYADLWASDHNAAEIRIKCWNPKFHV
jgi:hypothetical protein